MILIDTSVWVDHLRESLDKLAKKLNQGRVLCHPFVIGELACGNLKNRFEILALLKELPEVQIAKHSEVLELINKHQLYGRGLGWVDAHLLTSAFLTKCGLWTRDRRPQVVAEELKLSG